LIAFAEAAKLLQQFMPNKDARQWLRTDAQHDPVIPRILRGGEPHYDMNDLAAFVLRFLDPMAHLHGVPRGVQLQGSQLDRRRSPDRRVNPPLLLGAGIERRDYSRGDRRGVGAAPRGVTTMH
jgi:hypothetical protein